MKNIGIIGAGNIAKAVTSHLLKAGFQVMISNSKNPDTLKDIIVLLGNGAKAVTPSDAVKADIIILALPFSQVKSIRSLCNWQGKIVIDATNHFTPNSGIEELGGKASSEVIKDLLRGARLVKAFNTLFFKVLEQEPAVGTGHRVLFISGDDEEAKLNVIELIKAIGFAPIDLGSLSVGSKFQQAKGVFSGLNLVQI